VSEEVQQQQAGTGLPASESASAAEDFIVPGSDGRGLRHLLSRLRSYLFFVPVVFLVTGVLGLVSLFLSFFDSDGKLQHATARLWAKFIL
jgi:hypothetical protein